MVQPLLFACIGSALDFSKIDRSDVPSAVAGVLGGLAVRVGSCYTCLTLTMPLDWTAKEKLFVALAWTPKATVQAALAALPLDAMAGGSREHDAELILTTAVLAIILTAPAGLLVIQQAGPKWLEKNDVGDGEAEAAQPSPEKAPPEPPQQLPLDLDLDLDPAIVRT